MIITTLNIVLLCMAIWRMSSIIANEDGPFKIFSFTRDIAEEWKDESRVFNLLGVYDFLSCEWCNSVWLAIPTVYAWWLFGDIVIYILLPFSISAGDIAIKYLMQLLMAAGNYFRTKEQSHIVSMLNEVLPSFGETIQRQRESRQRRAKAEEE